MLNLYTLNAHKYDMNGRQPFPNGHHAATKDSSKQTHIYQDLF